MLQLRGRRPNRRLPACAAHASLAPTSFHFACAPSKGWPADFKSLSPCLTLRIRWFLTLNPDGLRLHPPALVRNRSSGSARARPWNPHRCHPARWLRARSQVGCSGPRDAAHPSRVQKPRAWAAVLRGRDAPGRCHGGGGGGSAGWQREQLDHCSRRARRHALDYALKRGRAAAGGPSQGAARARALPHAIRPPFLRAQREQQPVQSAAAKEAEQSRAHQ
jgi:hypothetical protein